ncbi:mitochondrial antiviral-signaling protein isoform X2 [Numida meleagris]|uniref:mitochondrial antiviral-signaling protein isoform X2 n=1 Tax=Numida meleagris TaxID=8996 RepID=UPI000B3DA104|nr:mitochondrial antiviral-signaling protein isoform X2 [Numida meleagris]
MGFAEDKVYNYILSNMTRFCNIHVASLVDSLSCLTDADRDELHTRQDMRGVRATVYKFYQHLKCRKGWVTDLINALHQNNAGHLAEELQQVYDRYRVRASAPPSPSAPVSRPAASSDGATMPFPGPNSAADAPVAKLPRYNPSAAGHPPLSPAAATAATSAVSSDISSTELDARAPVQESLPERKSPQPPLPMNTVCDGKEKPLPYPTEVQQGAVETPGASSTVLSSSVSPEQGREWLSPRHPVCVDNGCFGNANHLQRGVPNLSLGRSLPPRDSSAASGPEQTRNEPQEDVYISSELPVRLVETAGGGGVELPDSLRTQEEQPVHSSKHSRPPSSFVDVRNPLLIQQQFDAEQKQAEMMREHEGGGDVWKETVTSVSAPAPRGISPVCDTLNPPVREKMQSGEEAASSSPFMPEKEKVHSASVASLSGMTAAGSFEGAAGRTPSRVSSAASIWASHDNEEEDVELSKPGVLQSVVGESPMAATRHLGCPSSNTSSHHGLSSDPLMVSTDSSSPGEALSRTTSGCWSATPAAHADPGGEEAAGASPCPPLSWGSPSVGTHEVHVEYHPSALLAAGSDVRDGAVSFGNSPDSSRGCSAATSSSQAEVPTSGDCNGLPLLYVLPAVGIALVSVFLVYKRLQK